MSGALRPFDWHSERPFNLHSVSTSIGIMDKHFDLHPLRPFDWHSERPFDWHSASTSIGIMDKHFDWNYVKATSTGMINQVL